MCLIVRDGEPDKNKTNLSNNNDNNNNNDRP